MKLRVNYYLEKEQIERLVEIKKKSGIPFAETVRRALNEYFTRLKIQERINGLEQKSA